MKLTSITNDLNLELYQITPRINFSEGKMKKQVTPLPEKSVSLCPRRSQKRIALR